MGIKVHNNGVKRTFLIDNLVKFCSIMYLIVFGRPYMVIEERDREDTCGFYTEEESINTEIYVPKWAL